MHDVTNQDMVTLLNEIGEQAVVALVSLGDGEEHNPMADMLARKIEIINAITNRVKGTDCANCGKATYYAIVSALHNCNDCGQRDTCPHRPRLGENARINCVLWKEEQDGHGC